jgi:hypothetical protein
VPEEKRQAVLSHYLEGVGRRATERLVGVSHNSVMNRVLKAVEGRMLAPVAPEEVRVAEADEQGTYVGKKRGLLAVVGW